MSTAAAPRAPQPRVVICGAGVVGASVAYFLAARGVRPLLVDRARPGAAASGKGSGFLALDWNAGTPLDALSRAGFALHRELAVTLGAHRTGYRPVDAIAVAASDGLDLERHRRLPTPAWLDPRVVAHQLIGDHATTSQIDPARFTRTLVDAAVAAGAAFRTGVVEGLGIDATTGAVHEVAIDGRAEPADVVVLALGPWTDRAQRWLALPQVLATRLASLTLVAEAPAQVVFSEFVGTDGTGMQFRIYPRDGGLVYVTGAREHAPVPDDPDRIVPGDEACAELRRVAAVHAAALGAAPERSRTACYRPITVDGVPLIGPVPGAPGAYLATAHGSWGMLLAPATGRMIAEMVLDGASRSVDAEPFAVARLPAGRTA